MKPTPIIVALDHPSLTGSIDRFADDLRNEQRYFGPRTQSAPYPSLINRLTSAGAIRLGTAVEGRLIAMSRIEADGDATIAVVEEWRGRGVGRELLVATIGRAADVGIDRIVLRSSRRSRAVAALGSAIGATTVDQGLGRVDLIFPTMRVA